ncbi:hypothetical protein GDO86_004063 [Hymenochirus boettgeri]|uniref:Uncharacterized protein n=1 Tax=Hymenochirus boettgeri TaxID=247094 RepID=A0A8T2K7G0_9PIPI|nr:hypothetical protein GDO86_004063 [Hymenochirus boettgeri]
MVITCTPKTKHNTAHAMWPTTLQCTDMHFSHGLHYVIVSTQGPVMPLQCTHTHIQCKTFTVRLTHQYSEMERIRIRKKMVITCTPKTTQYSPCMWPTTLQCTDMHFSHGLHYVIVSKQELTSVA